MTIRDSGLLFFAVAALAATACSGGTPTAPTTVSTTTATTGTATITVAYMNDVKAVLDADCSRCHNSRTRDGGVDLSTYAAVRGTLTPGNANSLLIRVSRSGGSMFAHFSGDRAAKAELVRTWVVDNAAAESR